MGLGAVVRQRGHRADDAVAEPGLAVEHAGDLVDVALRPGDHDAGLEKPTAAGAVQAAAQQQAAQHEERDAEGEGQDEEPAGEWEPGEVADRAGQGRGHERGVDDALVLLEPGAEDVAAVATEEEDGHDPADQQDRPDDAEGVGGLLVRERVRELEEVAPQDGHHDAEGHDEEVGARSEGRDVAQPPARLTGHPCGGRQLGRHTQNPPISVMSLNWNDQALTVITSERTRVTRGESSVSRSSPGGATPPRCRRTVGVRGSAARSPRRADRAGAARRR